MYLFVNIVPLLLYCWYKRSHRPLVIKSLPHESGQIHIQGMHIAAASSLHHCRDLVCLSFADEG